MKGHRLRILYFSGILSVVVLLIFIYSQVMSIASVDPPGVEHSLFKSGEKSTLKFRINNPGEQDFNYTYSIILGGRDITGNAEVLIRANGTFQYSIEIPPERAGDGRANTLIYRGTGEGKMLIDNKTYYLR